MNKRILNILRMTFISIEFLVWVVFFAFYISNIFNVDNLFLKISNAFFNPNCDIQYLVALLTIPGVFLVFSVTKFQNTLQPDNSLKKLLNWEKYIFLKDGLTIGLFWNASCFILTIVIWLYRKELNYSLIGFLYSGGLLSSAISTFSIFIASLKIKEIIEINSKDN